MADANKASKIPQFVAGYTASLGGFNTGLTLGWASGGLVFIRNMRGKNSVIDSLIISLLNIGACISLLLTAFFMDRIGRKWTMMAMLPLFFAVWIILAFVHEDVCYVVMRLVMGIATGCYGVANPMYVGEICQKEVRGALGIGYQLFVTLGILVSFSLALVPNFMWFNLICVIPLAIFAVLMIFMPESPYFLIKKGNEDGARKSLQWLRGKNYNIDAEYADIKSQVEKAKQMQQISWKSLFTQKELLRAFMIGLLLMSCQQLSGINAVIFNAESIFESAASGGSMLNPKFQSIIIGGVQVLATIVAAATVEKFGRRMLMMTSMTMMGIFHVGLTAFFAVKLYMGESSAQVISWLPVLCLAMYLVGFSLGAGPIPWAMMGEIFADNAKSRSGSLVAIYSWMMSFLVTLIFELLSQIIASWIFFVFFAAICFLGLAGVFFFLVETKNRTFEEIQNVLEGNDPDNAPIGLKN